MRMCTVVLAALCFCGGLLAAEGEDWKTFKDEKKVFSFKYPANWKVDETAAGTKAAVTYASADGSWASNVQVNLVPAPPEQGGKDVLGMLSDAISKNLAKSIKEYKLIESTRFDMGKEKAQRLIFSGTQDNVPLRFIQVIAVRGGKAVLITCTTTDAKFADERPKFDKLIESFEMPAAK